MSLRTADFGSVCVASGPMWVKSKHTNRATHYPLHTILCIGELNAIRNHKCFLCSPFYVKGVSLGYVARNQNLKDINGPGVYFSAFLLGTTHLPHLKMTL